MKIKVIVLLLVLGAVLLSGCVGNQHPSPEKNATPTETVTSTVNATPVETATSEVNATPVETMTPEVNETPEVNVTSEVNATSTTGVRETPYLIRLENYRASVSSLDIKKGESVAWMNLQDNPKRKFTLVSQEGLFENKSLGFRQPFAYTFNETGDYNFYVIGQPRMNVSVNVIAP